MITRMLKDTISAQPRLAVVGSVCALFVCVSLLILLAPVRAHAEFIDSFTANIVVNVDATFDVVEDIRYIFEQEKHGIYRCIPTLHPEKSSSFIKERYIDVTIHAVTMDDAPVPFDRDDRGKDVCVKIGDPEVTITGTHVYQISYSVAGAISYPQNAGADLYWNVVGNGWDVPIRSTVTKVSSPDEILMRERACYRGREGKTDSCESITELDGVVIFSDGALNPHEGMTVAQALNRSLIAKDIRERYNSVFMWSVFIFLGLATVCYSVYAYKTKFKTGKTIIPQYEPYPGAKPMYAGFLFDKRLDPRDITAGIVYLAEQGFIKIKKIDRKVLFIFEVDDYEVTLLRALSEVIDRFEREIIRLLFEESASVGAVVTLSELRKNQSTQRKNFERLSDLRDALLKSLKEQDFFTGYVFSSYGQWVAGFLFMICIIAGFIEEVLLVVAFFFAALYGVFATGRRTRKGYEALDHLRGFKDFLRVTDRERFIFHNAPAKNAEQFMEYLPYAIAFGVEKQWAKTFEGITIPNPIWYDGGSGVHAFSAVSLSQSLGGFASSLSTSTGTSSSSSASGGGGFSGGGSGGGGGGSW